MQLLLLHVEIPGRRWPHSSGEADARGVRAGHSSCDSSSSYGERARYENHKEQQSYCTTQNTFVYQSGSGNAAAKAATC